SSPLRHPPCSPLFPYTTLFRSLQRGSPRVADVDDVGRFAARHRREDAVVQISPGNDLELDLDARLLREAIDGLLQDLFVVCHRGDRKSTRLNSSHVKSRMPSSA